MKKFLFDTSATMKAHNTDKFYIDENIIPQFTTAAGNIAEALSTYVEHAGKYGVEISENAMRTKQPIYIDDENGNPEQVGYMLTGSTIFENSRYKSTKQYINLWVEISNKTNPFQEKQ